MSKHSVGSVRMDVAIDEIKKSIRHGVWLVMEEIKKLSISNLTSKVNAAGTNNEWSTPLMSGVRGFLWKEENSASVHIYGNLQQNDGTWRLRFMETGTKPRYVKKNTKYKRKGMYLGQIEPKPFFNPAVDTVQGKASGIIDSQIERKISMLNK